MRPEAGRINRVSALGLWPLLGTKHSQLLDLTGPSLGTSYESPPSQGGMSMEGKENCICRIIYLVGQWFTLQCVKSHWAGPMGLMPHLDKESLRAAEKGPGHGWEEWYPCSPGFCRDEGVVNGQQSWRQLQLRRSDVLHRLCLTLM